MPDRRVKWSNFMDRQEAARYIGLSTHWLAKHANSIDAPRFIRHGRKVYYKRSELDRWLSDYENVHKTGAGGSKKVEDIWGMSFKRRVEPANMSKLEAAWVAEHGEDSKPQQLKRRELFRKFLATLTDKQQLMLSEIDKD